MPEKVTKWACKLCGKLHNTKGDAGKCEAEHVSPDRLNIVEAHFPNKPVIDEYGYPEKILVEITNHSGCLGEYVLIRSDSCESFYEDKPWMDKVGSD